MKSTSLLSDLSLQSSLLLSHIQMYFLLYFTVFLSFWSFVLGLSSFFSSSFLTVFLTVSYFWHFFMCHVSLVLLLPIMILESFQEMLLKS